MSQFMYRKETGAGETTMQQPTPQLIVVGGPPCVQVSLPDVDVKAGLALQPQVLDVSLVDRPLTDLLFTQFLASVSGKVFCLGKVK